MASYRYYKWEIITNKGNGEIQAGDFTMYSDSHASVKIPLSSYPYIINPLWTVSSGQEPSKLFDNQPYSKWYASTYWELYNGNGTWTNYNDLSSNQKIWIRIDTGLQNAISPKSYSWNTAEDVTGRDPISWKVYGSNDDTIWTLLSSIINYPTPDARITKVGVFDLFVIAPTNVVATIRNESAYVSWNEAQSGVQTYLVTVYSSNGSIVKTKSTINTNIIIDGLTNDNSYYFTVKTINTYGTSTESIQSNTIIPALTKADPPTNIKAEFNGSILNLAWDAPIYTGGSPITDYSVIVNPGNIVLLSTNNTTKATINNLPNSITLTNTYTITISVINAIGTNSATITDVFNQINNVGIFKAGYNASENNYKLEWPVPTKTPVLYKLTTNGITEYIHSSNTSVIYKGSSNKVNKVSSSYDHTLFLMNNGEVKALGSNSYGKCGQNTSNTQITTLTTMLGIDWTTKKAIRISAGSYISAILLDDNTIRVYGSTLDGNYSTTPLTYNLTFLDSAKIVDMKCSNNSILLLLDNGKVMVRGGVGNGEIGIGQDNAYTFTDMSGIDYINNPVKAFDIGANRTCLVMSDGTVMMCGNNYNNYFGLGDTNIWVPKKLDGIDGISKKAVKAVCQTESIIVLLDTGELMSIGRNSSYALGIGSTDYYYNTTSFISIPKFDGISLKAKDIIGKQSRYWIAIDTDNNKYTVGQISYLNNQVNNYIPTLDSSLYNFIDFSSLQFGTFAINYEGEVYRGGIEYNNTLGTNLDNWTYVPFEKYISTTLIAPINTGIPYTFSLSYIDYKSTNVIIGDAIIGNLSNPVSNISIDSSNNNAIVNWVGNANSYNVYINSKLYANTTLNSIYVPVTYILDSISTDIESVSAYGVSSKVSSFKNTLKSPLEFFSKFSGPSNLNAGKPIKISSANSYGSDATGILTENGYLFVIGNNDNGKLGTGNTTSLTSFKRIAIANIVDFAINDSNMAIVLSDGTVMSTGDWQGNGFGDYQRYTTFTKLPSVSNVIKAEAGSSHFVLLRSDGSIYVFGQNYYGQLGTGNTIQEYTPRLLTFDKKVINIAARNDITVLVMEDGTVRTTGYNQENGLGFNTTTNVLSFTTIPNITNAVSVSLSHRMGVALLSNGQVMKYGKYNTWGQGEQTFTPYLLTDVQNVRSVNVSQEGALFVLNDNTVKVLGILPSMSYGSGYTTYTNTTTWTDVSNVSNVFSNLTGRLFVIYNDGSVVSAGMNRSNALGYSTTSEYPNPTLSLIDQSVLQFSSTDPDNAYEVSFDINPAYPQYLPIQLNINNNLSLIPRHATNKFNYNGTKQAIKVFANSSDWNYYNDSSRFAILMSDGTVKLRSTKYVPNIYSSVYNSTTVSQFVDIPDLSNVVNILNLSSRISNPYAFVFLTADNRMKVMNNSTGAIVDCTDLSNIPYSWNGDQRTPKVPDIINAGYEHFVTADGRLYQYATNEWYKGEYTELTNIVDVTDNNSTYYGSNIVTYALTRDGKVYSKTNNTANYKVMGISISSSNLKTETWYLTDLSNVAQIQTPIMHWTGTFAVVLLKNGTLMYAGRGGYSTGLPDTSVFIPVPGITGVVSITPLTDSYGLLFSNGDVGYFNWYSGLQNRKSHNAVSITGLNNNLYVINKNGKVFTYDGSNTYEILPASSSNLAIGPTYTLKARGFLNNNVVGPYVNSSLPPISISEGISSAALQQSSIKIRLESGVIEVPVVTSIASAPLNTAVVVADTSISAIPIVAFVAAPTNDAQIGTAVSTTVNSGLSKIVLKQTVGGQEVKSLVTTQSASVSTPLAITSSSGATANIATNSAGAGNVVAASITNMDVSNSYVNMFIKVVSSSGSVVASGFNVPIELNIPAAEARDTVVLRRFNTTTNTFETIGNMTKKSGTTSTFQYTLTTNSNLTVVPCILGHTKVMTPRGPVAAAFLKNGDILVTSEGRQVAIRQIYTSSYVTTKETAPYKFEKGCLGKNYPAQSFEISPTHAVAVPGGWIIPKYASLSGIKLEQVMVGERVKYYHIELENYLRDNLVLEGGAIVESFGVNWLKSQPKNTVVYTFDHKSKLFTRPSYKSMKKITVNRK